MISLTIVSHGWLDIWCQDWFNRQQDTWEKTCCHRRQCLSWSRSQSRHYLGWHHPPLVAAAMKVDSNQKLNQTQSWSISCENLKHVPGCSKSLFPTYYFLLQPRSDKELWCRWCICQTWRAKIKLPESKEDEVIRILGESLPTEAQRLVGFVSCRQHQDCQVEAEIKFNECLYECFPSFAHIDGLVRYFRNKDLWTILLR